MYEGAYQTPAGQIIAVHRWNILRDGRILDATADQFGEGGDIDLLDTSHDRWLRYRPIYTEALNPKTCDWLRARCYAGCSDQQWQDLHPQLAPSTGWWLKDRKLFADWRGEMERRYSSFRAKQLPAPADNDPPPLAIVSSQHWTITHRRDTTLPGYLILSANHGSGGVGELGSQALQELGPLLNCTQSALNDVLSPEHIYVGRFGHSRGHAFHLHVVPICAWVKANFENDARYDAVRTLRSPEWPSESDGAELLLYVWREFCERSQTPPDASLSVAECVEQLRLRMAAT